MSANYIQNGQRVQIIDVDKYSKANYMTYHAPSAKQSSNCTLSSNFPEARKLF